MNRSAAHTTYELIYDLYEFEPGFYLPSAYIVSLDREGLLAHIQQRAGLKTIGHFGIELTQDIAPLYTPYAYLALALLTAMVVLRVGRGTLAQAAAATYRRV
ncbi:MAG: hypothetical protein R3350_01350, partial [Saprospiraceae bacterium]|nr:hypothetical protein [Saprospiraceae bacterium]